MTERIAVGSANPVKVAATERVATAVLGDGTETGGPAVESVPVDSGVPEQPRGREETVAGAENRARRALEAVGDGAGATDDGTAYGVGIEGGVAELDAAPGRWLIMWAAVTDGERLERGGGPSLRLPGTVAERVRAGEELGPVLDDLLDAEGISEGVGAAGVLTGEAIDRESALVHAVAGAFGPFATDFYD